MEHWEALCPGGYQFVYDDTLFRPGTDTFLLSSLPALKPGLRVCDLGCGTGLLGLLLMQRQPQLQLTGIEIQPAAADLARRTAEVNEISDRFTVLQEDLRQVRRLLSTGSFDLVVCNPPYYPAASGYLAASDPMRAARSEVSCTLDDICAAASYLLRWGGSFCLVHKPERLTDVLAAMRQYAMEPKQLRFVSPSPEAAPSLILVEGRRGGKSGLTVLPPLLLRQSDGSPSRELDSIYFRTQEVSS